MRLILPLSVESVVSLIPSKSTVPQSIVTDAMPQINSNISIIDSAINPLLLENFIPTVGANANPMQIFMYVCSIAWIIGILVMLLLATVSTIRLRRSLFDAVCEGESIWRSERVSSPFILGIIKPRIYLLFPLDSTAMGYVLSHEQAHIKNGDHFFKLLGYILLSVYWFNPVIWLAYILYCRDTELACDERVVSKLDSAGKKAYSMALLGCAGKAASPLMCQLAFGEIGVKERIKKVLNFKKPAVWITAIAVVICIIAAVCLLTDPKTEEPASKVTDTATVLEEPSDVKVEEEPAPTASPDSSPLLINANVELKRLYDIGILSHRLVISELNYSMENEPAETESAPEFPVRLRPSYNYVSGKSADGKYWINVYTDTKTGRIIDLSIGAAPDADDEPTGESDFINQETGKPYEYHDNFDDIFDMAMSLDDFCKKLCSYWGFSGYSIADSDGVYGHFDAPDGSVKLTELTMNNFYVTVFFDGDQAGAPMYITVNRFPTYVNLIFGMHGHPLG